MTVLQYAFWVLLCATCVISLHAQPSVARPAQRLAAPWPPPAGELRVIIDTDAANEVDDQWAIALALGFPERLKIEGFVAAHYGQRGGANGIAKSHASIEATLAAAGLAGKFTIKNGCDPLAYRDRVPSSAGVDFIIEQARSATPENPLWLILLGPATDGAAALLKDPSIADRVVIFWHGRSDWPEKCANFNAINDPLATQLLFELPCRFVLFDTGANLTMPMAESARRVGSVGPLGKFLHDLRQRSAYASRPDKGMFDLGDIAAFINPADTCTSEAVQAPGVRGDFRYDFKLANGPMVRITAINREASFALLDESLARNARSTTNLTSTKIDSPATTARRAVPVILDTDIGTDIDDTWALAQLLRSPELNSKLILTTSGGREYRSAVMVKFLTVAGRTNIPIGLGAKTNSIPEHSRNQAPWIKGYNLTNYSGEVVEDGVGRMIRIIEESPEPVTIIAIAPSGNLAAALARSPGIAAKCRLVGMFGSFDIGYNSRPPASAETNVRVDPKALRAVLAAPWQDVLLTPLDTCNFAVLDGENYHRLWTATDDPTLRAVIENYCIFAPRVDWMRCDYFTQRSTTLFDCVAVYLACAEDFVTTENVRFRITDDGFTVRDEHGEFSARVALRWKNLPAFKEYLTVRLLNR